MTGAVEKFLTLHKNKLEYALAKICARRKIKKIEDLLQNNCLPGIILFLLLVCEVSLGICLLFNHDKLMFKKNTYGA